MGINMIELKRKIDDILHDWKNAQSRKPMIVKGARQIGKSFSIRKFGNERYESLIEMNFILQPEYKQIFNDGFDVDVIVKNISFINPSFRFIPEKTLLFFDELQQCPSCATSLKSFAMDGRYDVICSGSLMGLNYHEIESNAVGYKVDIDMFSLDFEEFLWAKGFSQDQINSLLQNMVDVVPLTNVVFSTLSDVFKDYMIVGGMPAVVREFIENGNFSGTLDLQKQLLLDYREDITKYAEGLDKGRILNVYNHLSVFLAKDYKKFQISKVARNARSRDYVGVVDWLASAGIVNVCYCMDNLGLPLKGNYNPDIFKLYYQDTGLLVGSLDDEAQEDLRRNHNFNTYKGALFENVVAEMLRKSGFGLYFYRNEKSTIELDFMVRDINSLVPVEVKASHGESRSLTKITDGRISDIRYGIKFSHQNIGFNGRIYTFPYFLCFLLRPFLSSR